MLNKVLFFKLYSNISPFLILYLKLNFLIVKSGSIFNDKYLVSDSVTKYEKDSIDTFILCMTLERWSGENYDLSSYIIIDSKGNAKLLLSCVLMA